MNQNPDVHDNDNGVPTGASRALNIVSEDRTNPPITDQHNVYANDADEEGFDWQRLLSVAKRRRRIIGFTMLTVLSLATAYLVLAPRIYRASSDLLVNSEQKSGNPLGDIPAITSALEATGTRSQDTEVEILRSSSVQDAAIELMPADLRPKLKLKKVAQVDIQPKRSTDIITVNVKSRDPKLAVAYSNAVCEAYRLQNQKNNTIQFSDAADYVKDQLERVRKDLDRKRDELRKFKEANGVVDLTTESTARVARLAELKSELQLANVDRAAGEAQLKSLRAQTANMAPSEIKPAIIVVRPVVIQLRKQLTDLQAERSAALQEFVPGASEVKVIEDQIAALQRRLKTEPTTEVGTSTNNPNLVYQQAMQQISQTQASVKSAQARADELKKNIASALQNVANLPQKEYKLSQLQGDLATYQLTFQSLSDKYQTLNISQQTPVANARVITPAEEALKVSPRMGQTLALALIGGLMLSTVISMVMESLDNKIYTEESAVQITGLPVLTHVPLLERKGEEQLLIHEAEYSVLLECFRMLRTQLSFIASYGHLKTLVVTSSQPNEGKSTVSSNLAIALALNNKRVVIVDADLRRPVVHSIFGLSRSKGFSSVVSDQCTLEEALQETGVEGLQILPSGPTPPNPAELLDSRAARDVIEHLKATYDYVIIDAPPALMMADAQIISTAADGMLLVVSCQEARRDGVERTCELMAQAGIRIVGMVLNKFTSEQSNYYNYYGNYGHYGTDELSDKEQEKKVIT